MSRLHPFKGLEYLVDAISMVVEEQRKVGAPIPWFVICGPSRSTENFGDYRKFLEKRAEKCGVAGHLIFTGQVAHPEVPYHLAGADIFACPTIIEAQNKVIPEAAAVGTPAVATETTGIVPYLAPNEACISIPPRSPQAIADGILRLLNEPDLYHKIQTNALQMASTLRNESLAPQLEAVWEKAAGEG